MPETAGGRSGNAQDSPRQSGSAEMALWALWQGPETARERPRRLLTARERPQRASTSGQA
ncbi:hypothetical protein M885DRAFT_519616 [Pelagophyceae sp. CCMP2097]|nr:hypothetical protein M885DRAFT_519616 [Pelagophyceae sp. CCMP2097]